MREWFRAGETPAETCDLHRLENGAEVEAGEGLAGTAGCRGSWNPPGLGAASVLATLAFGLLGLEPDAPSGRIRVAPVLPAHLKDFRIRGIRVGGARLELAYERAGRVHRFHLDALDGRVPPMVGLEGIEPSTLAL